MEISDNCNADKNVESLTSCSDRERFLIELEFVQGLSNPHYLNWLAQHKYFDDHAFISYLKYLRYWKQPAYRKFIVYPQALFFLDLLQNESFRQAIAKSSVRELVHRQQLFFWQHYRPNRVREELESEDNHTTRVATDLAPDKPQPG
uniref:Mediator of RNA polymerase II transcription subunit 31 n=1 Tax=Tetraselmis sp. GSL018 TaxID=582737 RepID=A0A061RNL9_9CHLO|mmetsp:Transcript_17833/g.42798  ORF Transcript_17833/g.42798 Transcript_17833/m.42798 type:complete len:147 (+) Transcript_17833:85-525(+)|eukprot:CAMPEP_0177622830 /NCGR_PEP_ID=MMETSP0419_2-20121207/28549_1 /TAXON_ID=582737 /ORGANISM="Tetraselmis sp., Strain GSL018" /LENGTH=146 /DNA_ID=CAMNT_0019123283 /DNA_START=33 /DNA_END=473 /DNA_ORIENTATION=-